MLGMRPYRVQVIGGIVLHQGRIAEMKTGEGKTLVAILPAYLNALTGKGVHIVTVNDYLAKRDSEWMGKVYRFLGLTVGLIVHDLQADEAPPMLPISPTARTTSSALTICATTWRLYKKDMVQRGHNFVIVDEVDSILIDEARTPLIISGKGEESTKLYEMADFFVSGLRRKVFATTDEKEFRTTSTAITMSRRSPAPSRSRPAASPRPKSISAWRTCPMWRTRRSCTTSIRP